MRCPTCDEVVAVTGVFPGGTVPCGACGTTITVGAVAPVAEVAPAAPSAAVRTRPCPRCRRDLDVRDADGAVVSACADGHGVFVTQGVLEELRATRAGARTAAALDEPAASPPCDTGAPLPCPQCGAAMQQRRVAGDSLVVDTCEAHGTWFDAGELRAAVALSARAAAPAGEPSPAAPPDGGALARQAEATLDVALALEQARDVETARRTVDVAEDVVDLFGMAVLGTRRRDRRWT